MQIKTIIIPGGEVDVPSFIQKIMDSKTDCELKTELNCQINSKNGLLDPHLVNELEHRGVHVFCGRNADETILVYIQFGGVAHYESGRVTVE